MKRKLINSIGPAILCLAALLAGPATAFEGEVVGVMDGDTVEVMRSGRAVRVRLDGIDCPEKSQAFGARAKQFTSRAAFGKVVEVVDKGPDKYGRTLGEIILPDGSSLNRELVSEGYAWWYQQYSDDQDLRQRQKDAREDKKGLWSDPNVIPPWIYRQGGGRSGSVRQAPDHPVEVLLDREDVVFVTNTGEKYHQDGCRYLKSRIPMTMGEAVARGYEPCKVCKP
jgi:micrococcal nuclease